MGDRIDKEDLCLHERNGDVMAVLAKPINKITVVSEKDAKNFVREFNGNKVTKEFLDSCKKAGRLFGNKK